MTAIGRFQECMRSKYEIPSFFRFPSRNLNHLQGWTGFDFPGRNGKYSSFKWNFNHFSGVDYNADGGKNAIFKIHGENKAWSTHVDKEKGSYDYLMGADVDFVRLKPMTHLNFMVPYIILMLFWLCVGTPRCC